MPNAPFVTAVFRLAVISLFIASTAAPLWADNELAGDLTYERHVRPILKAHCFYCHGEVETEAGLDVRLRRLLVQGGESGAAIVPGKPRESHLYQRLFDGDMPPEEIHVRPTDAEIEIVRRWITSGAKTARPEPENVADLPRVTEEEREFWSFQPVRRPAVPDVKHAHLVHPVRGPETRAQHPAVPDVKHARLVRTPIDAFLLSRLAEHDLTFSPEAERRTLIRRVTFTLLGLPPTPEQLADFLADDRPGAYERLIDRTLDSPHYGERWARHWLDVAGYADSDGYDGSDPVRDDAWGYRDYVIRALNADKPWDEFIREQLAGDEMIDRPLEEVRDSQPDVDRLVATGFLRTAPDGTSIQGVNRKEAANQVVADTLQIVASSLLGLTVQCAQCHDHRFDPILQEDYYRLRAIFEPAYDPLKWRTAAQRQVALLSPADQEQSNTLEAQAKQLDKQRTVKEDELFHALVDLQIQNADENERDERIAQREGILKILRTPANKRSGTQRGRLARYGLEDLSTFEMYAPLRQEIESLAAKAESLRKQKPQPLVVRALTEPPGHAPTTYLFFRGDIESPRDPVAPGELTLFQPLSPPIPTKDADRTTTGRRLAYAQWLTSGEHPLVARVLVNRVWMHHFGRGLVNTPADFGHLGERPTHPEMLDWLACEFVENGWSLKHLHRVIMTSTAYRQVSQRHDAGEAVDAENTLYWRMPIRRLEGEALRDTMLAVSGALNRKALGPPVPLTADPDGQTVPDVDNMLDPADQFRRSIYMQVRRTQPLNVIDAFDGPTLDPNCEVRTVSTVPTQALFILNNAFIERQATRFAARLETEAGDDPDVQIVRAFQLALAREPSSTELEKCRQFLNEQASIYAEKMGKEVESPRQTALANLCQAILAANELLYVE